MVQWAPDLVEACARARMEDAAHEALTSLEVQAAKTGRTWAHAVAARCRGILADELGYEAAFAEALAMHADSTPFERARTELCLGERLRRSRRRVAARQWLRAAADTFERLGARPWAERALVELEASGGQGDRRTSPTAGRLTAQELQIALVVAEGATNREAGAALFLSAKTIETHLSRVYRKLEVRSRTELAKVLAREGPKSTR